MTFAASSFAEAAFASQGVSGSVIVSVSGVSATTAVGATSISSGITVFGT